VYVYIRDGDNDFTRWTIKAKPDIKEVGKNWNVAKYMELDGSNTKTDIYNAINVSKFLFLYHIFDSCNHTQDICSDHSDGRGEGSRKPNLG
jgi:hypothetical protein